MFCWSPLCRFAMYDESRCRQCGATLNRETLGIPSVFSNTLSAGFSIYSCYARRVFAPVNEDIRAQLWFILFWSFALADSPKLPSSPCPVCLPKWQPWPNGWTYISYLLHWPGVGLVSASWHTELSHNIDSNSFLKVSFFLFKLLYRLDWQPFDWFSCLVSSILLSTSTNSASIWLDFFPDCVGVNTTIRAIS